MFVAGYGAAQAGAFICFIPLLTLLLPGKAELIGGEGKAVLLGQIAMIGGLVAAAANLVFGTLSDRSRTRFGRRRPWILGGLAGIAASMVFIARSETVTHLLLAVVLFQIAMNALYGPLSALVPDMVPDSRKGLVSAWAGAALPVAALFTAVAVVPLAPDVSLQFTAVMGAAAILILPFALTLKEPRARLHATGFRFSLAAFRDRNFGFAFVSRLLMESAVAIHTLYLLYFLQGLPGATGLAGRHPLEVFGLLLVTGTAAATLAGFVGGIASDRFRARRPLVSLGGLLMAAGLGVLVAWPVWPVPVIAQLLFGMGHGLHATTVAAMTAEVLPYPEAAGRDLGVMNIAVALPQSLAPALAALLLAMGATLPTIFVLACAASLVACLALAPMRFR